MIVNKHTIFAVLGNQPHLSLAEIKEVLMRHRIAYEILSFSPELLILDWHPDKVDLAWLQNQLAGVIKLGEMNSEKFETANIIKLLPATGKVFFGFSFYALTEEVSSRRLLKQQYQMMTTAKDIKKILKERGQSARYVTSKEATLSSVIVKKNKLLTQGAELILGLQENGDMLWGITKTVQDFQEYQLRDWERPAKNLVSGMSPTKLAKMMVNLSGVKDHDTLLDPFCGRGTILQEAALKGVKKLLGSDLEKNALDETKNNFTWLKDTLNITIEPKLWQSDVRDLSAKIKNGSVDAVVTEPYLGPALKRPLASNSQDRLIKELSELYLDAFATWHKLVKPDGRVVMIWPVWQTAHGLKYLPLITAVEKLGWRLVWPLNHEEELKKARHDLSQRRTFLYHRPDQLVRREISLWQRS